MDENQKHIEALNDIRSLMERSSRFISLSGLSGVFVGLFALAGALAAHLYLDKYDFMGDRLYERSAGEYGKYGYSDVRPYSELLTFFFIDAGIVLLGSLTVSSLLSWRKAKKTGHVLWDRSARRVFWNMMIPLAAGGAFCLALLNYGHVGLIAPAMLIFYGLALVNASKYTYDDLRYLGLTEVLLGLLAAVWIGKGLLFWSVGFGLMHIIYGIVMYYRYDKDK